MQQWYTDNQIREMGEKAKLIVDIKDRKCRDKTFNASFIGREYCKWFIVNGVSICVKGMQKAFNTAMDWDSLIK